MNALQLSSSERKISLTLALVFAFRMLGLFMILPVFAIYAETLPDATPFRIGMVLGIYGLTQALFQLPLGFWSDRIGRKPIILAGLAIFGLGSIVAATAHSIIGIIIGRALQGAGAVGSTIIACLADLTREEVRTKAMAMIGMVIGLSFSLAMLLGPILNGLIGIPGIFWLTAVLAVCGIVLVYFAVPKQENQILHRDATPIPTLFKSMLRDYQLLRLDFGIFSLHAILTASFIVIPLSLIKAGLAEVHFWWLYLPVLLLSFVAMFPFIIIAEKKRKMKGIFTGAIAVLAISQIGLMLFHQHVFAIGFGLFIFLTAFTLLEASLPSLISKIAPVGTKGTAMGIYSTAQFLGIFCGGAVGGFLFSHGGIFAALSFTTLLSLIWLGAASTMLPPPYLATRQLTVGPQSAEAAQQLSEKLRAIPGVIEVMLSAEAGIAYLKVDSQRLDQQQLFTYSVNS